MKTEKFVKELLSKMTLEEKVAQMSQTVGGYRCYERNGDTFTFTDEFRDFIKNYGPMGAISNILRSCAWTKKDWGIGVEPKHRVKVANQLQQYVIDNSRLKIPVLIEVESNHGLQALGSEMFPTNVGMGSTFNPELYGEIMKTVGKETKLSGNHINFVTMFDMARDPRWGRVEEFFSEDPYLASLYAESGVKALKGEKVLPCCKHYIATGDGFGGLNTGEVNIGKRELHDIYLPVVEKAVKAGADVVMAAYNTVDGIPCHANKHLLRDVLRDEIGFEGIVLSDGWAVERMIDEMGFDLVEGSALAVKSGVDISLADNGAYLNLIEAVKSGKIDIEYIDQAVTRILSKKFELGLFDNPFIEENNQVEAYIYSGKQKELSFQAAAESMVLVKNDNCLPLSEKTKVALFGKHADNAYYMMGDYTSLRKDGEAKSIKEVFSNVFEQVEFTSGWDFKEENDNEFENALKLAEKSDVIVVTLGGNSCSAVVNTVFDDKTGAALKAEGFRDCGEGIDTATLKLPGNQIEFLRELKKLNKPIISVLIQGRTYLIKEVEDLSDAVIIAWYPGQQGAFALADVITGKVNPSGKLSVSIPYDDGCLPAYYNRLAAGMPDNHFDGDGTNQGYCNRLKRVLHPFGFGLSYSEFEYSDLSVEKISKNNFLVSLKVKNISNVDGKEAVQLYIRGYKNSIKRRIRELKGVKKIDLKAGEEKTVKFLLGFDELKIYSAREKYEVEQAEVEIMVGSNPHLPLRAVIKTETQENI